MSTLTRGAKILITETERGPLPAPELATVFEDYGTDYVNVKLANGQLHSIPRSAIRQTSSNKSNAKDVEAAVHAAQLYFGAGRSTMRIRDEQKLYERMLRKIDTVARRKKMDVSDAYRQITDEAKRRGGILPMPGKDI